MQLVDTMQVTCNTCGFPGTIAAVTLHSCDITQNGGRCEDYPCCGHTDGDGCQTLPSHTADFYHRNPHLLHEPGSPEWHDALDDMDDEGDDGTTIFCRGCGTFYDADTDTVVFENGDKIDNDCVTCRVRWFVENAETRSHRLHYATRKG